METSRAVQQAAGSPPLQDDSVKDDCREVGSALVRLGFTSLLTYLCPSLPLEHRPSTIPQPLHSVLGCSGHSGSIGPVLFQLCFSVSPPTVVRPVSLPLPLRVPGQGLVCGAGCWLPEGVSDPAPLPPQYLLGHWFLSHSLPQIFISDLVLPLDFVDAPHSFLFMLQSSLCTDDSLLYIYFFIYVAK